MKFELVDFYPMKNDKFKQTVGTIHLYIIDCELDIRGILVNVRGKSMGFKFPYFKTQDLETGQIIKYPHINWTNEKTQKQMMEFLHQKVKPKIWKILNNQS